MLQILAVFVLAAVLPVQVMAQTAKETAALATIAEKALIKTPAKKLFSAQKVPAGMKARAIGSYAKGCLAGGKALAADGPAWQVMRKSRNRKWGHPAMVDLVERLATEAKANDGWNGLLVGDLSQPRGGPMPYGHASHQIGLDADVWLNQMPDRTLTDAERESMEGTPVVKDRTSMNYKVWTEAHARLIRRAANYPEVARIFVHPPIKAELCKWAGGKGTWLAKVRPYYGHNSHFHIRINCPKDSAGCKNQAPARPKDGTGCGEELAYWMGTVPWRNVKRDPNAKPAKPAPGMTLAALPDACRAVVTAQ